MRASLRVSLALLLLASCKGAPPDDDASSPGKPSATSSSASAGGSSSSSEPPPADAGAPQVIDEQYAPPDPVGVDVIPDDGHHGSLFPDPTPPPPPIRARRRMDLDQLDQAVRAATAGIGWTETRGTTDVNLFQDLARTLGKPDFVEITTEDLEPSATFVKFMDDAARSVCQRLLDREEQDLQGHVFLVDAAVSDTWAGAPGPVSRNLARLLLRFHGRKVDPDAPELAHWKWLMRSVGHVHPGQPRAAWQALCVGLFTHPDFYSY